VGAGGLSVGTLHGRASATFEHAAICDAWAAHSRAFSLCKNAFGTPHGYHAHARGIAQPMGTLLERLIVTVGRMQAISDAGNGTAVYLETLWKRHAIRVGRVAVIPGVTHRSGTGRMSSSFGFGRWWAHQLGWLDLKRFGQLTDRRSPRGAAGLKANDGSSGDLRCGGQLGLGQHVRQSQTLEVRRRVQGLRTGHVRHWAAYWLRPANGPALLR